MSVEKREVLTGRQKIMPKINEEIGILLRKIEKSISGGVQSCL